MMQFKMQWEFCKGSDGKKHLTVHWQRMAATNIRQRKSVSNTVA
jgi:hypothetical protein